MSTQERALPHDPTPDELRDLLNAWGPYKGAAIRVKEIAPDWTSATVELSLESYNRNFFGTHFGGSLSSMTNPFYVLMLANILGREYTVWDTAQKIRYLAPGRGTVRAHFRLTSDQIAEVKARTADGAKFEPVYVVDIVDEGSAVIATVEQTLYVRKSAPGGRGEGAA